MDRILENRNSRNFLILTFFWYTHMFSGNLPACETEVIFFILYE